MRFIVLGAGALGGVVGARLHEAGQEVLLIARGPHLAELLTHGLGFRDEAGERLLPIPAVGHPREVTFRKDDVVLLAVKSQHTAQALGDLIDAAQADLPVLCLQNGVSNERQALRTFTQVYGVCANCPADNPRPGAVSTSTVPTGLLEIGRYPGGRDSVSDDVAKALQEATFEARSVQAVMAHKHSKLLLNLANAAKIVCGAGADTQEVVTAAVAEGKACLDAAGIAFLPPEQTAARRRATLQPYSQHDDADDADWRARQERTWAAEADHLNGEIVLLGREHGLPTPVNAALQRLAREVVRGTAPGSVSASDVLVLRGSTT